MTLISGFHPSINGDRKVGADFFDMFFGTLIGDGVFPNPSTGFQVVEGDGLQTIMRTGSSWIRGKFAHNPTDYVIQHDLADGVLKRIDRIVIRRDNSIRDVILTVKKGTFSSNPVPPPLQRDGGVWELALADVFIGPGATQITQANITDQRLNSELCGIVHALVEQVDTTTIFNQYQSYFDEWSAEQRQDFEEWFDSIKDILDGDVATNLAQLIATQRLDFENHLADYVKHPAIVDAVSTNNVYSVNLPITLLNYVNGIGLVLTADKNSAGNASVKINNLNAVPILKADGKPVKNLKANGVYTLRYSAVNSAFILQGEGGLEIENSDIEVYVAAENVEGDVVARVAVDNTLTNQPTVTFPSLVNTSVIYELSCTEDKSLIAMVMTGSSIYKKLILFENNNGVLTDITDKIITQPTANYVQSVKISNDGKYILVGQSLAGEFLIVYERDDTSGNYIKNTTLSTFNSLLTNFARACITPDNKYIFVAAYSTNSLLRLQNNFDGTFTQLTSINVGNNVLALNYRAKDDLLFLGVLQSSNNLITYKHSDGNLTPFKQNTVVGSGVTYATINFIGSTNIVAVGAANTPYIAVINYDDIDGLLSNVTLSGGTPTNNVKYIDSVRNGEFLLVSADGTSNKFFIYKRSVTAANTYEKLANPVFPANSSGRLIALTDTDFMYFNGEYFTPYVGLVKKLFKMSTSATNIQELAVPERDAAVNEKVNATKIWEA